MIVRFIRLADPGLAGRFKRLEVGGVFVFVPDILMHRRDNAAAGTRNTHQLVKALRPHMGVGECSDADDRVIGIVRIVERFGHVRFAQVLIETPPKPKIEAPKLKPAEDGGQKVKKKEVKDEADDLVY